MKFAICIVNIFMSVSLYIDMKTDANREIKWNAIFSMDI